MSRALAWLAHPVTVVAGLLLVLNDHLLKPSFPGPVTGKLSDVAGLVLAPALVALVLPARWAVPVTGIGFTLVKVSGVGAAVATELWGVLAGPSRVLADPTDLWALPALGLSWWVWTRVRDRPAPERTTRLLRVLVVLPFCLLSVAATSAYRPPTYDVSVADGQLRFGYLGSSDSTHWYAVARVVPTPQCSGQTATCPSSSDPGAEPDPARTACAPTVPAHCYRVDGEHLRVEESSDGVSWTTAWEVPAGRLEHLSRAYPPAYRESSPRLASTSVAVLALPGGDHIVAVGNQRDGLLLRDRHGTWTRIGFPAYTDSEGARVPGQRAPSLTGGPAIRAETGLAVGLALLAWAAAMLAARRRGDRWGPYAVSPVPVVAVGSLVLFLGWNADFPMDMAFIVTGAVALITGSVLATGFHISSGGLRPAGLAMAAVTAAATGVGAYLPFHAWNTGTIDSYPHAAWTGLAAAAVGTGLSVAAGHRFRSRPTAESRPTHPGYVNAPPAPPAQFHKGVGAAPVPAPPTAFYRGYGPAPIPSEPRLRLSSPKRPGNTDSPRDRQPPALGDPRHDRPPP
ncbi:hypothetical protein Lfu02_78500 [Longispora fulva]|uniref:Uncharacterized protein n=1 Tax=Longispora fulva TaxID=619741 RepID=A0A8J7G6T7_9ACTN|nr:hypothetical protein [Longispora fulva]MBG6133945.1 hypothetical protein [Longispora fulva]GIG63478.1 hypothetical protein Lfu02_78500 [Longispora fulva]